MRVVITIDPREREPDWVRGSAELWLANRARSSWRVRESEDFDGRQVLTFDFADPLDAVDFNMRAESAERRGRLV
jgi:hypothetical protein